MPIGDGPAPIVGVGPHGVRRRPGPFRTAVWVALAAALGMGLVTGGGERPAGAAGGAASPTAAVGPPLILVSQTPWVTPDGSFDLKLRAGAGTPPTSQLGVSVSVYPCLSSISAFDQSVNSTVGPSGTPIDATRTPVAVTALPVVASGGFDLSVPVYVGHGVAGPTGGFAIDLPASGGQCGNAPSGVYPVRVQLVDTTNGQAVGGFTTHLVFTQTPASTERLRVAVVLPVATTLRPAPSPGTAELTARPGAALAHPPAAATGALAATVATIAEVHPSVAVTLEAGPQTVADLATTGHQSTLDQLESLADAPSVHQLTAVPYVPVNASDLVGTGLSSELALQISRGSQVLAAYLPRAASPPAASAWITDDGVDAATLSQLETDGYRQLVVPSTSVPGAPTNGSAAEPFPLSPSTGAPLTVVAADADLAARFTGAPGNPVVAASQLVAELSQIYFEKPNDTTPRIVAAVAPGNWSDDPTFVGTLLGALTDNPVVEPVTTSALFATLPTSTCRTACRSEAGAGGAVLPAAAIRTQRQRIGGLVGATSTPPARAVTTQLGDLVLAGESERLRPSQQADVLHNTDLAVNAQLGQLQVAGDQSITLTSQRGRVPVTIVSDAPYPVTATLTLTSDKLLFPDGQSLRVTVFPSPHTNPFYFNVQTRASGLFKVGVTLYSPTGGVTLASGQVSVRSTATSVVGIVLSAGAVAVLVVWWLRTSRKRRRRVAGDEADDAAITVDPV
jgi:hypothetical protein